MLWDTLLLLPIICILGETSCLLKFDIFNLAISFSDLSIMFEKTTLDSCNSVWVNFLVIRDYLEWHLMNRWYYYLNQDVKLCLLVSILNTVSRNLLCYLWWHLAKILTLTQFGFVPDSLFLSISWSMESPVTYLLPIWLE